MPSSTFEPSTASSIIASPQFQKILSKCANEPVTEHFQQKHAQSLNTSEPESRPLRNLSSYIDHTLLSPSATQSQIRTVCSEALNYSFKAICVNPCHVQFATQCLREMQQKEQELPLIAAVVGFPLGQNLTSIKVQETRELVSELKVDEIDIVINVGWLIEGSYEKIVRELASVQREAESNGAIVKVIIESGLLRRDFGPEKIVEACMCCIIAGVAFVKTSTGFLGQGASLEDVALMHRVVAPFGIHVKASGGVGNREQALQMIDAGADRIGASKGVVIVSEGSKGSDCSNEKGGY